MNVFVSGATGLIGRHLVQLLEASGHSVIRLVRSDIRSSRERYWDTGGRRLNAGILEGCDALIHLAGEKISGIRWNEFKKDTIYDSRISSTARMAEAITRMPVPPRVFIVASATGYYGNCGSTELTESSPPGSTFLSEVCQDWEHAANPARNFTRVVHVRTGMVLTPAGGALRSLLPEFRACLGGVIGRGSQYWSWISLDDICRLYQFCIENESIVGPINGVSPQPVTNREFTRALSKVLHRPALIPLPALVARIFLGEMAEELLLSSARVLPQGAVQAGFQHRHTELTAALKDLLSRR